MPTDILLLECIDVTGVAEEMGCADADAALEDQLHAVRAERLPAFAEPGSIVSVVCSSRPCQNKT
jgi:tagatose-1,6-bisphosphate aldolase non-catalytic subunit AgaZ/GatZ